MKRTTNYTNKIAGWIYSAFTVALLIGGFFAPPLGIIDNSVLTACGILFGFAALDKMPELIKKGQSAEVVTKNGTRIAVGSRSRSATRSQ